MRAIPGGFKRPEETLDEAARRERRYALDEVVEATLYVETGQKTGNVVLRVSEAAAGEQPEPAAKQASFAKRSS